MPASYLTGLTALLGLASVVSAFPAQTLDLGSLVHPLRRRAGFDCGSPAEGLSKDACEHMSKIKMSAQGENPASNNGKAWIGEDGPNKFKFTNAADSSVTVVLWEQAPGDYQASFMNARAPIISYTLAKKGDKVTVSVANGVSGGWAGIYGTKTTLTPNGQIQNTWGEYTTGQYATADVSREVTMSGNKMSIKTSGGCTSDWDRCVFECKSGDTCGEKDTYTLKNCEANSQPGANYGEFNGQPEGGCGGWSDGGELDIQMLA